MNEYLGLIVKATRLCNLRCAYCHDWRASRDQTMSFQVMASMTARALASTDCRAVEFIWHGGETTILPIRFYEKALLVQARLRSGAQRVQNSLQTNGTRITSEWARFFKDYQFHVSVSLDGPPMIHDRNRLGISGQASSADVMRGIAILKEAGVPFSVLMVIDEEALHLGPEAIFEFFAANSINDYGLLAAKPANSPGAAAGTPTSHYVNPARMSAFLCRLYDLWAERGNPNIHIRELDAVRGRVMNRPAGACTLAGGCFGRYYLVEPNGDVAHCDLFLGDARYTVGNILSHSFSEMSVSPKMKTLRDLNDRELAQIRSCPEFKTCNGWCPHERYTSVRHSPAHVDGCCGLRDLISHVRNRIEERRDTRIVEKPKGTLRELG